MSLCQWGWNSYFQAMWSEGERENSMPARVVSQQRKFWRVAGQFGICLAEASGKLRLAAEEGAAWPAVGDWVSVELRAGAAAVIRAVLTRRNRFIRKWPGKMIVEQVIAANVDTALVISALDGDFNPRRVERYLAQCWDSAVKPVLILNKADACENTRERAAEMERVVLGTRVFVVSAKTGQGIEAFKSLLIPGQTIVMLGSSGVGKSTLTNRLLGESLQKVNDVRANDSRGQHTTTARELFALPGGALLIDTPGLRELQLWDAEEGLAQAFADISLLATQCAIQRLPSRDGARLCSASGSASWNIGFGEAENHRKLLREQEFLRRKMDPEVRSQEKQRIKRLTREARATSGSKNLINAGKRRTIGQVWVTGQKRRSRRSQRKRLLSESSFPTSGLERSRPRGGRCA